MPDAHLAFVVCDRIAAKHWLSMSLEASACSC